MSEKIRYRVKSVEDILSMLPDSGIPGYSKGLLPGASFFYKGYEFVEPMWGLCGKEVHDFRYIKPELTTGWFGFGLDYYWHKDWLDPIPDNIIEDINE